MFLMFIGKYQSDMAYTGHYFNEYEEAYKNMEKRAKDLLVQNLCRNKNFLRKNKTNRER